MQISQNADLLISLHINTASKEETNTKGIDILYSAKNTKYLAENKILATILYNYFYQIHSVNDITQPTKGVYVIDASHCPSVLVECGSNVSKRPCFCKRRKWPGANREKYITVY